MEVPWFKPKPTWSLFLGLTLHHLSCWWKRTKLWLQQPAEQCTEPWGGRAGRDHQGHLLSLFIHQLILYKRKAGQKSLSAQLGKTTCHSIIYLPSIQPGPGCRSLNRTSRWGIYKGWLHKDQSSQGSEADHCWVFASQLTSSSNTWPPM